MFCHKRSFFPWVLAMLTITLASFIYASFVSRSPSTEITPVSRTAYESKAKSLMSSFLQSYEGAQDDLQKQSLIETTMNEVLSLRVPTEDKDAHLQFVLRLNQLKEELASKQVGTGLDKLKETAEQMQSWK